MKTFKKAFAVVMCVVMTLTTAPLGGLVGMELPSLFDFEAEAATISSYSQGDIIEFGWYPQSEVTDSDIIAALNAAAGDNSLWTSYRYYSGTGSSNCDGKMTAGDYMRYKDICYGTDKYRGVVFDAYRPCYSYYAIATSTDNTQQDENGYIYGNVYWFKYEPVKWRVLDSATGMVMSETILDAQMYNNYVLRSGRDNYKNYAYWGDSSKTYYANNYAESSIREWLNDDFYNTAFSVAQQNIIVYTSLDNTAYSSSYSAYNSASTNDKIYLLSYDDVKNSSYGFSSSETDYDTARRAYGSDYSKCQGLYISTSSGYEDTSEWWLRSSGSYSYIARYVYFTSKIDSESYVGRSIGIRPAFNFNLTSEIFQSDVKDTCDHTPGEWKTKTEPTCADGVSVKKCTICQAELETQIIEAIVDHTPGEWETKAESTCVDGVVVKKCTVCQAELETQIIEAVAEHTPGEWETKIEPTCTDGVSVKKCVVCQAELETQIIEPVAKHTHGEWETKTEPTCTSEGVSVKKCTICQAELEIQHIDALGHTDGEWEIKTDPTCTGEGVKLKKCTVCSEELETQPIDATGHTDGEWKITTNPTTSSEGEKTLYCATCNEPIKTASVPMLDHVCDYLEWEVNEDKTVTITDCDTSYSGEFSIPATIYEYPVTGIGSSAFYNCDNITKITIPATVTSIKDEEYSNVGFHTCDNLESIVVDEANEKYSSENGVLYNKDKTKLISVPAKAIDGEFVMPSTVTAVSRYAFDAHNGIKLTLSDNLSSIDWSYINAKEFVASDNSENFATVDGVLFNKAKTTLVRFPVSSDITEYDIPEGVKIICEYSFKKSSIKRLGVPASVVFFKDMAFEEVTQLQRVDYHCLHCWCELQFEVMSYTNTTYANPLRYGAKLYIDDILIDDLDSIGTHNDEITKVNAYAFYGYDHFRSLTIPSSVQKIGEGAFACCDNLKLLTVYGNVTEWGDKAFYWCPDLYTVQFAEGTTEIGAEAFWSCDALQELYIPSTMTYICNGAFYGYRGQTIDKICFGGTSSQWSKIDKTANNFRISNSTISYHKHTTYSATKLVDVVNPTCTETGYTGDRKNSSCLMYTSLGKVVPAAGHKPGEWETKVEPGCVSEGTKVKKCTVCKEEVETDTIPVTGHDYKAVVTEPTCTEGGYTTNTCSKCSNFYRSDETEATGHKPGEWETKVEPGCESEGTKVKKCTVCKEEVETDTIPATDHDYKATVTPPTCTVDGYTTHTCSVCKDTYTDSVVKAEGHKYDRVVTPNTCTTDGYTTHTCSVCEDTYTDSETKATGHSHESKVTKEPTCTNTGIRTFTCHCGDSYTEVIKANGHTKGEWEYIGGNEYAKSCTVCGDKLESKIVTVDMFFNSENVNKKQVLNKSTATVTATVTDNFVNDLVFASSDNSTVSVDANGNVVANNIGKATITVTIKDTAISDSIEVEVLPRDFTVTWNVNGKQTKQTVKEEAKFTPNVNTTLKGYKFIGWDMTVPTAMPAENLTFTAQYELVVKQLKIKNPSTSTINYGETLVIHADFGGVELPEGWKIQWTVEGAGFDMAPAADGLTCKMTSVANGNATVKATLVDENGEAVLDADSNEMSDSKQLTSKAGFFQKLASFFKNLFGISRIILQSI